MLDIMLWLMGDVESVQARLARVEMRADRVCVGLGQFVVEELVEALEGHGAVAVSHRDHSAG